MQLRFVCCADVHQPLKRILANVRVLCRFLQQNGLSMGHLALQAGHDVLDQLPAMPEISELVKDCDLSQVGQAASAPGVCWRLLADGHCEVDFVTLAV